MSDVVDGRPPRVVAWSLLSVIVVLIAVGAQDARTWPSDNRPSIWMRQGDSDPWFSVLESDFGGDEAVLVRADRFALDRSDQTVWLARLGKRLAALPGVSSVVDPFHLPGGTLAAEPGKALRESAERRIGHALNLARMDPPRADFLVRVAADASQATCQDLAARLDELAREAERLGIRVEKGGHPLIATALDDEARRVENVFSPLLAVASLIGVALALRSALFGVIAVLPAMLVSVGIRVGLKAIGWPANLILVSVGPISFVIVLAASLHLVASFRRVFASGASAVAAARAAFHEKLTAGILAGGTSSVGFLACLSSGVDPVRRLGMAAAAAIGAGIAVEYGVIPVLLAGLVRKRPVLTHRMTKRWRRVAIFAVRRRACVVGITLLVIAAGGVAPQMLPAGTNALDYFPVGHRVREQFVHLDMDGGGLTTIELLARRTDGRPWAVTTLADAAVDEALSSVPGVLAVIGPEVVAADVRSTVKLGAAVAVPLAMRESGRLARDGRFAHWTIRIPTSGAAETRALAHAVLTRARATPVLSPAVAEVAITGSILRVFEVQSELVGTLWSSLSLTLAVTIALFFLVIRSFREMVAALLANLLPVGAVLVAPWSLGWQLDAATCMVASVVLGLAYNTFHLLHGAGPSPGRFRLRPPLRSFGRVGDPAATSYLVLALGFSVLIASGFIPTARFGFLTALGVLFALLGDLFVLPAIWLGGRVGRYAHGMPHRTDSSS